MKYHPRNTNRVNSWLFWLQILQPYGIDSSGSFCTFSIPNYPITGLGTRKGNRWHIANSFPYKPLTLLQVKHTCIPSSLSIRTLVQHLLIYGPVTWILSPKVRLPLLLSDLPKFIPLYLKSPNSPCRRGHLHTIHTHRHLPHNVTSYCLEDVPWSCPPSPYHPDPVHLTVAHSSKNTHMDQIRSPHFFQVVGYDSKLKKLIWGFCCPQNMYLRGRGKYPPLSRLPCNPIDQISQFR